jgi:type I restriction-modification system DNA methylase subunit
VLRISEVFAEIEAKDVEEIFGGTLFFETVLGVKEESEIPVQYLRDAASYLLANQILFYQILAKEKKELIRYRVIDVEKLQSPSELQTKYFSRVLLEDYKPIFGFDVSSKIKGSEALEAIRVTVDSINALSPEALGHDVLGKIFHNLIPFDLRKVVAAFYTNIQAGEILATLAIDKADALVLDPACGSGTLLVSSYQRKKDLTEKKGESFSFRHHKRFLEEEITGVDVMPFAAHLAAVHLSLQAPLYTTDFVRVAIQDATKLRPGYIISAAQEALKEAFKQRKILETFQKASREAKEKVSTGAVELSDQSKSRPIELNKVDLVIMNPPFTRYQRIPPSFKKLLATRFSESKYKQCLHGQSGLHGYFLLLADRFIKGGGRIAAVLPVTTLSARGLYGFQDILFKDYSIEHLIVCEGRSAFSENVLTREILLVAKKTKLPNNKIAVSILRVSPDAISIGEARSLAETFKELRKIKEVGATVDTEKYLFRLLAQENVARSKRSLFKAISMYREDIVRLANRIEKLFVKSGNAITFEEYLKNVKGEIHESPRGIENQGYYGLSVVSAEDRALKKHDFWYVKQKTRQGLLVENRFSHLVFDIPRNCFAPNIRRYAGLEHFDITGKTDYVIIKPFGKFKEFLNASDIKIDERKQALKNVQNGRWEEFVREHSSKLALFYRVDITGPGTRNLAFYSEKKMFLGGSLWEIKVNDVIQNRLLCLWFNSTLFLFQVLTERKETRGGWIWLDNYVLGEFMMPNFSRLSKNEVEILLKAFDNYGGTSMPSLLKQLRENHPARNEIDRAFLQLLGMNVKEIDPFLSELYRVIAREINTLREVMAEGRPQQEDDLK